MITGLASGFFLVTRIKSVVFVRTSGFEVMFKVTVRISYTTLTLTLVREKSAYSCTSSEVLSGYRQDVSCCFFTYLTTRCSLWRTYCVKRGGRFRTWEVKLLRTRCGSKKEKVKWRWRKCEKQVLRNFCSTYTSSTVRMNTRRRMVTICSRRSESGNC